MKARRCACPVLLLWFLLPAMAFAGDRHRTLSRCSLPDVGGAAFCGSIPVPEDPEAPGGRRIALRVAVLPATGEASHDDPLVPLMGGPGEAAVPAAGYFAERLASLRRDRDVLLVDQRGTGGSNALNCDLFDGADRATRLRHLFPAEAARRCAAESRRHANLDHYDYAHAARDLEHVRTTLGYGRLNLHAGSYGTRAAQVHMRLYPESVRTAYLGSVVPLDVPTPLTMARSADTAIERLLATCTADADCNAAYPQLGRELREIDARLVAGTARDAGGATLSRGRVMEWFRSRLYRPATASELPWIIHRAHRGDWQPIAAGIVASSRGMSSALSVGLFLAITCREDVAFLREDAIAQSTRGSFLGDFRVREQMAACADWPRTPLPAGYREPLRTSIPTMFVSGVDDAASPLWFTRHVAAGFSDRVEIVARNQGHTEWSPCIAGRYERFVRSGSTQDVAGDDCADVERPAFRLGD